MTLSCHNCLELISQDGYYDANYQAICPACHQDWSEQWPLESLKLVGVSLSEDTPTNTDAYLEAYSAFLDQQAAMEQFFTTTATMVWTLPVPHSDYYRAELKTISLIQAQFQRVEDLITNHGVVSSYPTYLFTAPGRIVNHNKHYGVITKTVVSNHFWDYVIAHKDKPWHWGALSSNCNCDLVSYRKYPNLPWNVDSLCRNVNMSLEWLQEHPLDWNWSNLSGNLNLDITWLQAFPTKPWSTSSLICQPHFDISWVAVLTQPLNRWNWQIISDHGNFKWAWLVLYQDHGLAWSYSYLSKVVPPDYFAQHLDKAWDAETLANRSDFSLEFLAELVAKAGSKARKLLTKIISKHPDLNLAWLVRLQDLHFNWITLTYHDNFNWTWVEALPNKGWSWSKICEMAVIGSEPT